MEEIRVISGDIDGAALRREKRKNPYFTRCKGKKDNEPIQEALDHVGTLSFTISGPAWERIFRRIPLLGGNR